MQDFVSIIEQSALAFKVVSDYEGFPTKSFDTLKEASSYILKIKKAHSDYDPLLIAKVLLNYEIVSQHDVRKRK